MNRSDRGGIAWGGVLTTAVLTTVVLIATVVSATVVSALQPGTESAALPPAGSLASAVSAVSGTWRMITAGHYGGASNASGYSAIIAPRWNDAWVFGGTNPGGPSRPVAEHWDGHSWRTASLPGGLGSFISGASASGPGQHLGGQLVWRVPAALGWP